MRLILLAAAALVATPLIAQQASQFPGQKNASFVTGGAYTADPGHTLISWEVDHIGFTPYFGLFGDITGTLNLDPKKPTAATVDITIPVSKVITTSGGLNAHLLREGKDGGKPDFFGPAPADAHFVSTSVKPTGTDKALVTGNLTLNGVTKPVTLDVAFYGAGKMPATMGGKETVGFEATTTVTRSQFGINGALPVVSDAVKLKIAAAFVK
ncbi:YceI family protein [Sphingomonas qilianensis]|uniref:YceI family protein n=1 Tax=Sphingomonas qilianensis TaxID=1736690 RepID=A0ABU9XR63_9SPHN